MPSSSAGDGHRPLRIAAVAVAAISSSAILAVFGCRAWWRNADEPTKDMVLDLAYTYGVRFGIGYLDGSRLEGRGISVPSSLRGQTVVVTGGTKGCGFHAALRFKQLGASVVLSGRSPDSSARAASKVFSRAATHDGKVVGLPLDLTDFQSGRRFVSEVIKLFPTLNYLILNAGTSHSDKDQKGCINAFPKCLEKPATCPAKCRDDKEWVAPSGHNRVVAGNHLGHFLITVLLAPYLSHGATVVVVSSLAQWFGNPHWMMQWWGKPPKPLAQVPKEMAGGGDLRRSRVGVRMYATSKLANLVFARTLRSKLAARNVTVVAMTPGYVDTEMAHKADAFDAAYAVDAAKGGDSVFKSAFITQQPTPDMLYPYWMPQWILRPEATEAKASTRHTMDGRKYIFRCERLQKSDYSLHASIGPEVNAKRADQLWRWSREAVGLPPRLDYGSLFIASPEEPAGKPSPGKPKPGKPKGKAQGKAAGAGAAKPKPKGGKGGRPPPGEL